MEYLGAEFQKVYQRSENMAKDYEKETEEMHKKLQAILDGVSTLNIVSALASPKQSKKRAKRLSSVSENEDDSKETNGRASSSSEMNDDTSSAEVEETQSQNALMPPPAAPEHEFTRPVRAAKLKSEKCLKELPLNAKLRRPSNLDQHSGKQSKGAAKIKLENEQRQSQMLSDNKDSLYEMTSNVSRQLSSSSKRGDDSIVVIPGKEPVLVEILSDCEEANKKSIRISDEKKENGRDFKVMVKREKLSLSEQESRTSSDKTSTAATISIISSAVETNEPVACIVKEEIFAEPSEPVLAKRTRKKKKDIKHKPIKVERFSNLGFAGDSPISSRTRRASPAASVYEDAVENLSPFQNEAMAKTTNSPTSQQKQRNDRSENIGATFVQNETMSHNNLTMAMGSQDATFVSNPAQTTFSVPAAQTTFVADNNAANATVTISSDSGKKGQNHPQLNGEIDATFNVKGDAIVDDSLITEDESFEKPLRTRMVAAQPAVKIKKITQKTKELFNPFVQSPVKKKVEAFENHAATTRSKQRGKTTKENSEVIHPAIKEIKSSAATTPSLTKPYGPALGRFLTPTQSSNVTPLIGKNIKKMPNSTSKTMPFPKQAASNLKAVVSTSTNSLSRENSADEFKKGFNKMQKLVEERKKQREQKHLQAAQAREAKDRERAERLQKIAKEREEKKLKKQLEAEQKKHELDEIYRKLKLQEEKEAAKQALKSKANATEIARQEKELLLQMKAPKVPKSATSKQPSKYIFDMLHEDDSTDEESKVTYKRPPPPAWSLSSNRAPYISSQAFLNTEIIDSFFSVQPMTPDLKLIFPNIDSRYLKRNSSVIWQTPPRYSEMPKY